MGNEWLKHRWEHLELMAFLNSLCSEVCISEGEFSCLSVRWMPLVQNWSQWAWKSPDASGLLNLVHVIYQFPSLQIQQHNPSFISPVPWFALIWEFLRSREVARWNLEFSLWSSVKRTFLQDLFHRDIHCMLNISFLQVIDIGHDQEMAFCW